MEVQLSQETGKIYLENSLMPNEHPVRGIFCKFPPDKINQLWLKSNMTSRRYCCRNFVGHNLLKNKLGT